MYDFLMTGDWWMKTIVAAIITAVATLAGSWFAYNSKVKKIKENTSTLIDASKEAEKKHSELSKEHNSLSREHDSLSKEHFKLSAKLDKSQALLSNDHQIISSTLDEIKSQTNEIRNYTIKENGRKEILDQNFPKQSETIQGIEELYRILHKLIEDGAEKDKQIQELQIENVQLKEKVLKQEQKQQEQEEQRIDNNEIDIDEDEMEL